MTNTNVLLNVRCSKCGSEGPFRIWATKAGMALVTDDGIEEHEGDTDSPSDEEFIRLARDEHQRDGEVEIDNDAVVSRGGEPISGAYVQAWVWVDVPGGGSDA